MWFKLVFVAAFLFAATVASRSARQAARTHGDSVNQLAHEVRGLIVVRATLGIVFYTALFAWLGWSGAWSWMYLPVPTGVRWAAVILLVATLVLLERSYRALGDNYRGGVGLYPDHALITTGPYRYMRHPIYVAFIAIMCLLLPLSANWVLAVAGLLLVVSIAAVRIPIEERELDERFGVDWQSYRRQTGGLVPRLRTS